MHFYSIYISCLYWLYVRSSSSIHRANEEVENTYNDVSVFTRKDRLVAHITTKLRKRKKQTENFDIYFLSETIINSNTKLLVTVLDTLLDKPSTAPGLELQIIEYIIE